MTRAVIYARCSTEEESQKDALAKQVMEAEECVRQKEWILVDSYVESCSGTSTKGRVQYKRLYEDLARDRFDVIVIKSQDRLMRNTKDWYLFIDRLSTMKKQLYMYIERKFYCADDALITGIKAILAEEYSRELSKKINNAHHNRQKNGGAVILTSNTYGYRKMPDKSVEIVEEEAEIKRRMYELCAAGYGCRSISSILQKDGILNRKGKTFSDSDILRMIRNPINKGTVVMNRAHYDFDSKRVVKIPEEEQYIYEKKIPAIVSEELWNQANEAISNRREKRKKAEKKPGISQDDQIFQTDRNHTIFPSIREKIREQNGCLDLEHSSCSLAWKDKIEKAPSIDHRGRNPGKFFLSGKIICGLCEEPYYRTARRRYGNQEKIYEWKCKRYLERGRRKEEKARPQMRKVLLEEVEGCDNVHLRESLLLEIFEQIYESEYKMDKRQMIGKMLEMSEIVLSQKEVQPEIEKERRNKEKIREQMNKLVDKLLEGVISDRVYQIKQKDLERQLEEITEKIQNLKVKNTEKRELKNRLSEIEYFLKDEEQIKEAAIAGMLEEVDKIVIYPHYMEIWFDLSKMLAIEGKRIATKEFVDHVKVDYGTLFDYQGQKREDREKIVSLMKENSKITAKQIAKQLEISLSKTNYQINVLKKEKRIFFDGKGGRGEWKILK